MSSINLKWGTLFFIFSLVGILLLASCASNSRTIAENKTAARPNAKTDDTAWGESRYESPTFFQKRLFNSNNF